MIALASPEIGFVTGSPHHYGPETLAQVARNSPTIVDGLGAAKRLPVKLVSKPVLKTPDEIRALGLAANPDSHCAGLVLWIQTFSPSKMGIGGLTALRKPFVRLHPQFNRDLPWATIDMDFVNLHQSAHGDRGAGFRHTRPRLNRKVVVGRWQDPEVQDRLAAGMRAARAWHDTQGAKFARFGDTMRQVAGTEGDKVSAEIRFGYAVNGDGVGDFVKWVDAVSETAITGPTADDESRDTVAKALRRGGDRHDSWRAGARQGIEPVVINADTRLAEFKQTLRNNEVYSYLSPGRRA